MQFLDRYRAAVFDLDGTLADSLGMWDKLNADWCASRGLPDADAFIQADAPLPLSGVVDTVQRMYGLTIAPEELLGEWETLSTAGYATAVRPMPGAAELVRALHARGLRLSVATATFRSGCEAFLRAQGLLEFFDCLSFTEELGRDKSHPDVYLHAARGMGVAPADCVVFEDLPENARGVRAAGMGLVLVHSRDDWHSLADLHAVADLAVASLTELL